MPPLAVRFTVRWLLLMLLGSVGLVVMGALISSGAFSASPARPAWNGWFGWVAVVFFGAVGLILVWRLLTRTPEFVLSDQGFDASMFDRGVGRIAWTELAEVSAALDVKTSAMLLVPRDPQTFAAAHKSRRWPGTPTIVRSRGLLLVSLQHLDVPAEVVVATAIEFHRRATLSRD